MPVLLVSLVVLLDATRAGPCSGTVILTLTLTLTLVLTLILILTLTLTLILTLTTMSHDLD